MPHAETHLDRLLDATYHAERCHFWFRGFRRFIAPLLDRAVGGRKTARILDCGCGTGANLDLLASHGEPIGLDYTFSGLARGRRDGRRRLVQGSATHLPFRTGSFDLVTSFDMLQVLPDDSESKALAEMRRVLAPGGALVVNVSALAWLRGHHSVLSGEHRRYTRPSLRAALERAGFVVERLAYTNLSLVPLMAPRRLLQRRAGLREDTEDIRVPPAPVNAALSIVLAAEATLARIVPMPLGSSIAGLARRP